MGIVSEPHDFKQTFSVPAFSPADLLALEARLGRPLPAAYQAFILSHAGQTLDTACFVSRQQNDLYPTGANEIAFFVSRFLDRAGIEDWLQILAEWPTQLQQPDDLPPTSFLAIAELETDVDLGAIDTLLLGVGSGNEGQVYFLEGELGQDANLPLAQLATFLAPDFPAFLAQLVHFPDHEDDPDLGW
ncbi:SMI1/KNR4 family protein [Hymenobacter weizhouensis]|uniref:SMI1/KNR4 family protein n=1 Tax=Hymenobacter sp. YIM 151500-1 TaxID=2987689 RepID=UPI002227FE7C|nr:SMI1/KNR4 family protein [Hymenobacter sp. YIM 151500-1]UYZ61782.1 SMI1/KNR4 family protein [Hymenobacter sp. YIM 151500-1]